MSRGWLEALNSQMHTSSGPSSAGHDPSNLQNRCVSRNRQSPFVWWKQVIHSSNCRNRESRLIAVEWKSGRLNAERKIRRKMERKYAVDSLNGPFLLFSIM